MQNWQEFRDALCTADSSQDGISPGQAQPTSTVQGLQCQPGVKIVALPRKSSAISIRAGAQTGGNLKKGPNDDSRWTTESCSIHAEACECLSGCIEKDCPESKCKLNTIERDWRCACQPIPSGQAANRANGTA